ncbi:class I SAM-dependent methyltransferase [Methanosphaerula palustris]|uniref:Methyltransferase type 11 n=1 Tax=Methanosphaerula palustris (strain ATCC BAA-1556 / DSM 19958 / E1-9c) TaxID=521011 RepID=B8GH74_METPE|nr:methyltransferase domain-containing protein [Methanosphaerula palustris]ACL16479.1 Methyltransferase type 11 [Methanosphaerula palustris E1-9c]
MSEIDWESPESADRYDKNCDHQFRKGKALMEILKIQKGDSVLDVGCGTGVQALNVSEIIGPSGRLTGIDPSTQRIELARKKFAGEPTKNVRFLVGQAEDLGEVPDNSINRAYFCSSFHWVDDKRSALKEIYRVLVPGGRVGMTTLERDSPDTIRSLIDPLFSKYNIERGDELQRGIKRVTAPELHDLFSDAGFTGISVEPRNTPRRYGSPEEFLKYLEEKDRSGLLLKKVPKEIREEIRQEITRELETHHNQTSIEFGNVTLFAIASKPDERN